MLSLDYIGGFFDADGSVSLSRRRRNAAKWGTSAPSFIPIVSFSQCDLGLLQAVAEVLEGTTYTHFEPGLRSKWGIKANRTSYSLAWSNKAAIRVAKVLEPHCFARRPELKLIREFHETFCNYTKGGGRGSGASERYHQRVSEMSEAGNACREALTLHRATKNTRITP